MPAHYTVGVALRPANGWLVAVDYKRINYSGIGSVGNPSTNQAPLGSADGPGFGWQDVDVWKVGRGIPGEPDRSRLRAGYGHTDNPILSRDVTFNILAPGVVKDHYTLGFTYAIDGTSEITGAYMHAKRNSVTGASFFNAFAPGHGRQRDDRDVPELPRHRLGQALVGDTRAAAQSRPRPARRRSGALVRAGPPAQARSVPAMRST